VFVEFVVSQVISASIVNGKENKDLFIVHALIRNVNNEDVLFTNLISEKCEKYVKPRKGLLRFNMIVNKPCSILYFSYVFDKVTNRQYSNSVSLLNLDFLY
jgi:hypothetical protein